MYAVDHGKMAASLHDTGRIEHCPEDGFKFQPPKRKHIDWLVCDMVEQPSRIVNLIGKWLINGTKMKVSDIIRELNRLGGKHGIGIIDIVENRVVGMKSRGVYETPGGTILMAAHDQLEELILDRETMEAKKKLGSQMAQVVYEGKWFTPLREAIQAFVESTQEYVTGEVKFKLYKCIKRISENGITKGIMK